MPRRRSAHNAGMNPCFHPDWIVPQWPVTAPVRAVFTTRAGGASPAPWDSLNLGSHVGDAPQRVHANRERLAQALGGPLPVLEQVHGSTVLDLDGAPASPVPAQADAVLSTQPGTVCAVLVADCLPVLLAHRQGSVVAAAHAGWRGLAGAGGVGVLETTFSALNVALVRMGRSFDATEIIAWLGPCIGPEAFEVGEEVRAVFCQHDPGASDCFVAARPGHWRASLPALARQRLRALGVVSVHGNDGTPAWCTFTQGSRFFSYRRDQRRLGATGRMAACVWIDGGGGL